mgnify:CR=1 FL=1
MCPPPEDGTQEQPSANQCTTSSHRKRERVKRKKSGEKRGHLGVPDPLVVFLSSDGLLSLSQSFDCALVDHWPHLFAVRKDAAFPSATITSEHVPTDAHADLYVVLIDKAPEPSQFPVLDALTLDRQRGR